MIISLANLIVDHDAAAVAMRTQDTMRYVQAEWNKSHEEPIDTAELHKFLCDEHYGDLTEEQYPHHRRYAAAGRRQHRPRHRQGSAA